jgi:hypothetical protein
MGLVGFAADVPLAELNGVDRVELRQRIGSAGVLKNGVA